MEVYSTCGKLFDCKAEHIFGQSAIQAECLLGHIVLIDGFNTSAMNGTSTNLHG